jgi:large subunit ribosomal protein L15
MPLIRRLPKRGFNNTDFKPVYAVINLDTLEERFPAGATIDELHRAGADPDEWPEDLNVRQLPEPRQ